MYIQKHYEHFIMVKIKKYNINHHNINKVVASC